MYYTGNTQQKIRIRMNQHFAGMCNIVNKADLRLIRKPLFFSFYQGQQHNITDKLKREINLISYSRGESNLFVLNQSEINPAHFV